MLGRLKTVLVLAAAGCALQFVGCGKSNSSSSVPTEEPRVAAQVPAGDESIGSGNTSESADGAKEPEPELASGKNASLSVMDLENEIHLTAFDSTTGWLAVSGNHGTLDLYQLMEGSNPQLKLKQSIPLGSRLVGLVIKKVEGRSCLVYAEQGSNLIRILDLTEQAAVDPIQLDEGSEAYGLAVSEAGTPYVYFSLDPTAARFGRADLLKKQVQIVKLADTDERSPTQIRLTPDENWLINRDRLFSIQDWFKGSAPPRTYFLNSKSGPIGPPESIRFVHGSMFRHDAKMDGNFNRVGSNTIDTEFYPFAWSEKRNIAIGFSGQNFAWGDPDSKIVVDSLPLPAIWPNMSESEFIEKRVSVEDPRRTWLTHVVGVFQDDVRDLSIVIMSKRFVIVKPKPDLKGESHPVISHNIGDLEVGSEATWSITCPDAVEITATLDRYNEAREAKTVEKYSSGEIKFTPSSEAVGQWMVTIEAKTQQGTLVEQVRFDVVRPGFLLETPSKGFQVDRAGNLAACWGEQDRNSWLGIYDLKTDLLRKVQVPCNVLDAKIHDNSIFALLSHPRRVIKLNIDSLSVERTQAVNNWQKLVIVGDKFVAGGYTPHDTTNWRLTLDSLGFEPIGNLARSSVAQLGEYANEYFIDGYLYDRATGKPKLLVYPRFTRNEAGSNGNWSIDNHGHKVALVETGFRPFYLDRFRQLGPEVRALVECEGEFTRESSAISFIHPTFGAKNSNSNRLSPSPGRELLFATPVQMGAVASDTSVANKTVYALFGRRVYQLPIPDALMQSKSFFVEPEQPIELLTAGKPFKLKYKAEDAGIFWLDLRWSSSPLSSQDSQTGIFDVESPTVEKLVEIGTFMLRDSIQNGTSPTEAYKRLAKSAAEEVNQLTGRTPKGFVVPIVVTLLAANKDSSQRAAIVHTLLFEVPEKEILKKLESAKRG